MNLPEEWRSRCIDLSARLDVVMRRVKELEAVANERSALIDEANDLQAAMNRLTMEFLLNQVTRQ